MAEKLVRQKLKKGARKRYLSARVALKDYELVQRCAEMKGVTPSLFIVEAVINRAKRTMSDYAIEQKKLGKDIVDKD